MFSNFVVYFTNEQIANVNNPSSSDVENPAACGYLDYKTNNQRTGEPSNAIGAFQITDGNGFVYHFSLPVYNVAENSSSYNYDENFSVTGQISTSYSNSNKYVASWKLTAITGPDYKDLNSNRIADDGDEGFWISFNYGKWADEFFTRFPICGLNNNLSSDGIKNPNYDKEFIENYYNFTYRGSVTRLAGEVYYLNTIKTATHSAVFVKEYRKDSYSNKEISTSSLIPSLRLEKVMLFRNKDNALSLFGSSSNHITHRKI